MRWLLIQKPQDLLYATEQRIITMRSTPPNWIAELASTIFRTPPHEEPSERASWGLIEDHASGVHFVRISDKIFRIVQSQSLGWGFSIGLLGAQYEKNCQEGSWPESLREVLQREYGKCRYYALTFSQRDLASPPRAFLTFLEDRTGNLHLIEMASGEDEACWVLLTVAVQLLTEQTDDPARFDDYGDFLTLGAPSIVQRHSTERLRKHISKRVVYDRKLCTHCLRCTTVCNEMRAIVTEKGAQLLGPSEDFCTNCGLCQKRCSFLAARPKEELEESIADRRPGINEGGPGIYLHGNLAKQYLATLKKSEDHKTTRFPYSIIPRLRVPTEPSSSSHGLPIAEQIQLDVPAHPAFSEKQPLLVTAIRTNETVNEMVVIRALQRAALVLQTRSGKIELEMALAAMKFGIDVTAVAGFANGDILFPVNEASKFFYELGRPTLTGQSLVDLWQERKTDIFLAPYADRIPVELHQLITEHTGRQGQILSPNIPQAFPFSRNPLLTDLRPEFFKIFTNHPELMRAEASYAQELLQDIPRNHALIHARYRNLAFASGHSACPSCAEAQVLAIPVYMSMAMSLARGEIPQVCFTCETGCMSETLNKVNEVAQKVPGGRTVFGGGFAMGEAIAMAQDRAVRMGYLHKGRRYVVSQGGDGGAVIGLPAWLNALRQQAFMISQRHSNVLHFINITDTQVYSNTGGESSATSLLGMGTLTTPVGKFLIGNQKIQWNLINLAAEFPGILVGSGHSANRTAMQQFWQLADQLGQSAIRWDVTPCPETGKFFGEDPDDLAEIMAHAGMLPEVVFVGRFRKRITPYHPEDRDKPYTQWGRKPKPITYWLHRDPRYRALFQKNPQTGKLEPRNLTAHFLIMQLDSFRDQLNWQIDLETHLVRQAEDWAGSIMNELKEAWKHYRYRLEQFQYAMLFNQHGDLKPEYMFTLEMELVRRILGWDELARYLETRDLTAKGHQTQLEEFVAQLEELEQIAPPDINDPLMFEDNNGKAAQILHDINQLRENLQEQVAKLKRVAAAVRKTDPVEEELFPTDLGDSHSLSEARRKSLYALLDRIIEERSIAKQMELQQFRLAQQLKHDFLSGGGLIREPRETTSSEEKNEIFKRINQLGPFSVGVASLAGDRGIAINRIFANFFTAKGAWAGMAWQFGSSKRGTPVLSATFVDSKPLQRKDAMYTYPMTVLLVTNFEEMKRQPDLFFGQLHPKGFLIINSHKPGETLWNELVNFYPEEVRNAAVQVREKFSSAAEPDHETILDEIARILWNKGFSSLTEEQRRLAGKISAMAGVRMITVDMDGIMQEVTGSTKVVSNLVAIAPIFQTLQQIGFPFRWERDLPILTQSFPAAVVKNPKLLNQYYAAMEKAKISAGIRDNADNSKDKLPQEMKIDSRVEIDARLLEEDPSKYLMIMGGTLAGMVLSQIATAEHPVFYVGFPITPAGNPFYAMAEAFANGHPYIVVDEVNPSEKVAAEKLLGIARNGGFLPVTFTASQGWRLFTEVIPQFVGARLEGLFLIAKRALAAPNLNIEESHTDFMSFRDDGGIMLAPKGIQEYVPALYLARLLTHFAKIPVILSIGGITDTHKIGLVKVPSDERVRAWLKKTLRNFDFLEHKLINRQGELIVHGPSGTSAVYQETQSELEKAHQAAARVYPYAVRAVRELTGIQLDELEIDSATPDGRIETLFVLQGSLYPNAVESLQELEEKGWSGMACMSVRCFNPFPEEKLFEWFERVQRIAILDRSNSFGSIPPLASRVLTSLARFNSFRTRSGRKHLRILVGGLGGREITVPEMKEILLSTHLLFHPPQEWEIPLIQKWLAEDELLQAMMQEAAALDLRNTNRHTRVPQHLRTQSDQQQEYKTYGKSIEDLLAAKNYTAFLANHHQVEFIGPREILQETTLLQQIVLYLEIRLAKHAIQNRLATWRHAIILLHYSNEPVNHEIARSFLESDVASAKGLSPFLLESYGASAEIFVDQQPAASQAVDFAPTTMDQFKTEDEMQTKMTNASPQVQFDAEESLLIESILQQMVTMQGEHPLFYNPEDYEYQLVHRLQSEPSSALHELYERWSPDQVDEILFDFKACYRDVIDRTLQQEVLAQHHAPELRELFEGEGLSRLKDLTLSLRELLQEQSKESMDKTVGQELERYLRERCLTAYPKNPSFYLEYYRNWVAPTLLSLNQETRSHLKVPLSELRGI